MSGKVFTMELSQSNKPSQNKNWQKIGKGQRASEEKLRAMQMIQRNKQKGLK